MGFFKYKRSMPMNISYVIELHSFVIIVPRLRAFCTINYLIMKLPVISPLNYSSIMTTYSAAKLNTNLPFGVLESRQFVRLFVMTLSTTYLKSWAVGSELQQGGSRNMTFFCFCSHCKISKSYHKSRRRINIKADKIPYKIGIMLQLVKFIVFYSVAHKYLTLF